MKKTKLIKSLALTALTASLLCSCGPDDLPGGTAAGSEIRPEASPTESLETSPTPIMPEESSEERSEESSKSGYQPILEYGHNEVMMQSIQEALSRDPFDNTVSSPFCSGPQYLLELLLDNGHMPDEFWWINEDLFRETFPIGQYLSAGCRNFVLNFEAFIDSTMVDVPGEYGMTMEEMEYREMKVWPWDRWTAISGQFDMYITLYPQEEPPEIVLWTPSEGLTGIGEPNPDGFRPMFAGPLDEDGNLLPTPEPTPFPTDRQPVEEYQPPQWQPVPEHEGYEMAIVAETDEGLPLAVRLRWQREGYWFLCQIPGHCLEDFLQTADKLWTKTNLSDYQEDQEPQRGIE